MSEGKPRTRRNVTITLEEDVARWARIEAARRDTSVSQLISGLLADRMREEDSYEAAMRAHFAIVKPMKRRDPGERYPTRDELYDRPKRWS